MSKSRTLRDVKDDIEYEGFDYALIHYSDYSDIDDDKFQDLYKQYKELRKNLIDYLGVDE